MLLVLSKVEDIVSVPAALKIASDPKLILLSLESTVPTTAVPWSLFELSWNAITTLLLEVSNVAVWWPEKLALKATWVPKEISVPLTVPTIAFPLLVPDDNI